MSRCSSRAPRKSRRTFLKTTAAITAGAALTSSRARAAAGEGLAVSGGKPAVTVPTARQSALLQWPRFGREEKKLVLEMLDLNSSNVYDVIPKLEESWRQYHQAPYAKLFCNGTSALTAMYFALDLPPGSEIMVPSYTFFGTILPMRFFGYVPIFIDIDPRTACFDLEHARQQLTPNTRAMVPMHSWGMPCEMDKICAFAKEHGLIVIEDAAHAHGAAVQGKKVGAWGDMSITSFQATKPLPGIEGGAGLYQKREHYERASVFGDYKAPAKLPADSPLRKYDGTGLGLKLRIHPLAAGLISKQFETLDSRNAVIAAQVRRLNDAIMELPGLSEPFCRKDIQRIYYSNNIVFFDEKKAGFSRTKLVAALKAENVWATSGDYPEQHKLTVYAEPQWWHHAPKVPAVLPGTQQVNATAVNLPLFRDEAGEVIDQYIAAFKKIWAHREELA